MSMDVVPHHLTDWKLFSIVCACVCLLWPIRDIISEMALIAKTHTTSTSTTAAITTARQANYTQHKTNLPPNELNKHAKSHLLNESIRMFSIIRAASTSTVYTVLNGISAFAEVGAINSVYAARMSLNYLCNIWSNMWAFGKYFVFDWNRFPVVYLHV